jgi:hypothetical protein
MVLRKMSLSYYWLAHSSLLFWAHKAHLVRVAGSLLFCSSLIIILIDWSLVFGRLCCAKQVVIVDRLLSGVSWTGRLQMDLHCNLINCNAIPELSAVHSYFVEYPTGSNPIKYPG